MKTFSNKQKPREFITTIPALKEMLKDIMQMEKKGHWAITQIHMKE